ncbi:hypothetical protein N2603_39510 [Bradyrhizobium huanghuaihaiense]|uniref:hypothetical protein n=1 Tax=Bradyrhizobium huanghuaihaiense TaxID=990078 RepID=UPI0021AA87CB|nr:hypothetical protein [Bradyrhizobium sp. CB3035]UWU75960.1 hypothetical protein N2603_39510 [Bradyrhizobium sp. CB3035]
MTIPLSIVLVADPQPTNISPWQATIPLFAAIVTALFGFIGVLVGLRWNAKQAEKTEQRLRRNKREVLRISLWAELSSLAHVIKEEISYVEENTFTWIPLVESFKIYIENIEEPRPAHAYRGRENYSSLLSIPRKRWILSSDSKGSAREAGDR